MSAATPPRTTSAAAPAATPFPATTPGLHAPTWPAAFAARYRAAGHWRGETFGGMLRERAAAHPDRIALVDPEPRRRTWTYRDLDERADLLAAGLAARGITKGDRVVLQLPNTGEFVEVVFALFRIGALPVFALPAHRDTEIGYLCAFTEAVACVVPDRHAGFDHRALASRVKERTPSLRHVFVAGDPGEHTALAELSRGAAPAPAGPAHRPEAPHRPAPEPQPEPQPESQPESRPESQPGPQPERQPEPRPETPSEAPPGTPPRLPPDTHPRPQPHEVAFLQLSGGTTGVPKLIARTHDDYLYSVRGSNEICGVDAGTRFLVVLPAAHNFPMSSPGWLGALYAGGTAVLCPRPDPATAFALIARERITMTGLVPPLALLWTDAAAAGTHDLASLETVLVGGAKFSEAAARRLTPALGCRLTQVFGMAEGLVCYTRREDDHETVVTTQGRPISPDDEIRVVDDAGADVPDGESGHLLTRGPYTIRGYWRAPGHNATAFTEDGFYRTGDIVRRLPTGHLVVEGRAKDQINRGGEKVAAEEIENIILAHPSVHDVSVVAVADAHLGERSLAYVVLRPGAEPLRPAAVKRFVRERGVAGYKVPDLVEFVDTLPRTGVGKISKNQLRSAAAAEQR